MLIFILFAPQMSIIFAISISNNLIINIIYAWMRWRTSAWYLPGKLPLSWTGPKFERSTFKCNICSNFTNRTWRSWLNYSHGSCEWVDCDLEVEASWVELKQILNLKVRYSDFSPVWDRSSLPYLSTLGTLDQGWICRLPGAKENITVSGVAPVPASTDRVP